MRYARIEDGIVVEIIPPHPDGIPIEECFHPEFVAALIPEGQGMVVGGTYANNVFGPVPVLEPGPTNAERMASQLNSPFMKDLVEAIEDTFPMARGALRNAVIAKAAARDA